MAIRTLQLPAILLMLSMTFLTGCESFLNCIDGSGDIQSESRDCASFTAIRSNSSVDVLLTQGEQQSVVVEADDNIIPYITTEVRNGQLIVDATRCFTGTRNAVVHVTVPRIENIELTGSGNLIAADTIRSLSLKISSSGSGDISLRGATDNLTTSTSGSGLITLHGRTTQLDASGSGSGDIEAFSMTSERVNVYLSGSGDGHFTVTGELRGSTSGSGDVEYRGNPSVVDVKTSGSGSVRHVP